MVKQTVFNKDVKKIFNYFINKIEELDPHMSFVMGCTCSYCKEHEEIENLINKVCE